MAERVAVKEREGPELLDAAAPRGNGVVGDRAAAGRGQGRGSSGRGVADIAAAMGLVTLAIALLVLFTWRPGADRVREVDPLPVARLAAREASFPILLPRSGEEWRATSARWDPSEESMDRAVWVTAWVSSSMRSVDVVQSSATNPGFVTEQTKDGHPVTTAEWPWQNPPVGNDRWVAYESESGDQRSLVHVEQGQTLIVTGDETWNGLVAFADTLQPLSAGTR